MAVGTEGHLVNTVCVLHGSGHQSAVTDIPDANKVVRTCRGNSLAIRTERHAIDIVIVAEGLNEGRPARDAVELHYTIRKGRGDKIGVWREHGMENHPAALCGDAEFPPVSHTPDPHGVL